MHFLGHSIIEIRVIETAKAKVVFQDYNITDPEIFAQKCSENNGKFQVYFSVQQRDGKGASYENVPTLTWIPIDIDAKRPNKKTEPANEEQRQNALRNAAIIIRELKNKGVEPSLWVDTGNGSLILIRVPAIDTAPYFYKSGNSVQNTLSDEINFWLQHCVKPLCDDTVEVDSVGDLPRILGVPGTINMKSPRDQPRLRRIIYGDIKRPPEPQPNLWSIIEDCWRNRETAAEPTETRGPAPLWLLPKHLRDLYENPDPSADRSLILTRTLIYLANEGFTKDECVSIMPYFMYKIGRERWPVAQQYDKLMADGKIRPSAFKLGKYILRVRGDTAIVYEGDKPICPLKLKELNSHSSRKSLAKSLELDQREIDRVAATVLHFHLKAKKNGNEAAPKVENEQSQAMERIDPETREKAMHLLQDPALFYKLGRVFEYGFVVPKLNKVRFVIGEDRNKRLCPIVIGSSAKRRLTSILRVIGGIGTSKDSMLRLALALLSEAIKSEERGYLTPGGLRYSESIKTSDVLYIPDSPEFRGEMGRQIRLMRSDDGGLCFEYSIKDRETGLMTTVTDTVPIKMLVTTSNELRIDPALESGAWTMETDSSEGLTQEVQREKLRLRAGKRATFPENELRVWKVAMKIVLTEELPERIEIPYAESLTALMSKGQTAQRRTPDKLCDLIESVAFFRRFQKPTEERNKADLADLYYALQLGLDALVKTIAPLDQREKRILDAVRDSSESTIRDVASRVKIGYDTAYNSLERLVDKNFLLKDKNGGKNVYSPASGVDENEIGLLRYAPNRSSTSVIEPLKAILSPDTTSSDSDWGGCIVVDPISGKKVEIAFEGGRVDFRETEGEKDWLEYPHVNIHPGSELEEVEPGAETGPTGKEETEDLRIGAIRSRLGAVESREGTPKGTREKIDVILQLIDLLEVKSGSANLDELEDLAEKEGIDRSDFGALIARMLREGLIVENEDKKGVKRAGPKPPPAAVSVSPNSVQSITSYAEHTGPMCQDCEKWRHEECVMDHPGLILAWATYARNCPGFVRKKVNKEG